MTDLKTLISLEIHLYDFFKFPEEKITTDQNICLFFLLLKLHNFNTNNHDLIMQVYQINLQKGSER